MRRVLLPSHILWLGIHVRQLPPLQPRPPHSFFRSWPAAWLTQLPFEHSWQVPQSLFEQQEFWGMQAPLQFLRPLGQAPLHDWAAGMQPSPHFQKPSLQRMPQVLFAQVGEPFAGAGHGVHMSPQVRGLSLGSHWSPHWW